MADSIIKMECYLHSPKQTKKNPLVCNQGHSESYVWNRQRLMSVSDDSWLLERQPIYLMQVKGNNSLPPPPERTTSMIFHASLVNNLDCNVFSKMGKSGFWILPHSTNQNNHPIFFLLLLVGEVMMEPGPHNRIKLRLGIEKNKVPNYETFYQRGQTVVSLSLEWKKGCRKLNFLDGRRGSSHLRPG